MTVPHIYLFLLFYFSDLCDLKTWDSLAWMTWNNVPAKEKPVLP